MLSGNTNSRLTKQQQPILKQHVFLYAVTKSVHSILPLIPNGYRYMLQPQVQLSALSVITK